MKITHHIKHILLLLLTFLLGTTPTHAKTEAVFFVPSYTQHFTIAQTAQSHTPQKTVPLNTEFTLPDGTTFKGNCNIAEFQGERYVELAQGGGDLASFVSKSLSDKLAYIDNIWNTKYPIPDMLGGRSFLEDIMGQYRYTQASGWHHTGDISFNFKGIDFYKGTETGNQIFANTAVSMKTTIQTDVNTWLNYQSIKDNIKFLRDGMDPTKGIFSNNKTMFITDAKIHIYMPKANITPTLKTQWMNRLNADYPDISFEIKAIEDFIN